jgi:hypothetical protein
MLKKDKPFRRRKVRQRLAVPPERGLRPDSGQSDQEMAENIGGPDLVRCASQTFHGDPNPGLAPDSREKNSAAFLDWIESLDVALTDAD